MSELAELIKAERSAADLNGYYEGSNGTGADYKTAKAATDAAIANLTATQAVSLPDRETTIYDAIERVVVDKFKITALGLSDEITAAVLAALSTQPADEQVRAVQGWMALDLHMALGKEPDMRSEVENQGHSSWADWWAELCGEVRGLSAQPAAGEVAETVSTIDTFDHLEDFLEMLNETGTGSSAAILPSGDYESVYLTYCTDPDGTWVFAVPPDVDASEESRRLEWIKDRAPYQVFHNPMEVQPAPELAELFPGTLEALDRLSIRPEVQS